MCYRKCLEDRQQAAGRLGAQRQQRPEDDTCPPAFSAPRSVSPCLQAVTRPRGPDTLQCVASTSTPWYCGAAAPGPSCRGARPAGTDPTRSAMPCGTSSKSRASAGLWGRADAQSPAPAGRRLGSARLSTTTLGLSDEQPPSLNLRQTVGRRVLAPGVLLVQPRFLPGTELRLTSFLDHHPSQGHVSRLPPGCTSHSVSVLFRSVPSARQAPGLCPDDPSRERAMAPP